MSNFTHIPYLCTHCLHPDSWIWMWLSPMSASLTSPFMCTLLPVYPDLAVNPTGQSPSFQMQYLPGGHLPFLFLTVVTVSLSAAFSLRSSWTFLIESWLSLSRSAIIVLISSSTADMSASGPISP